MASKIPVVRRLPVGYLECNRRIDKLKRFQDLIRHRERWAIQIEFARPLEDLVPAGTTELARPEVIDQQIARLQPLVSNYLRRAVVETVFSYSDPTLYPEKSKVVRKYDVIRDYFELPGGELGSMRQHWFEKVMNILEQGIGMYQARREQALRDKFNPLVWFAGLLRAPLLVLDRAGLLETEEAPSKVLMAYLWMVRLVFLVILALVAARLGVSVPWDRIGTLLKVAG